jgi:hypothetical protein
MTTRRRDGNPPSEFSDWFRNQPEIDSKKGFRNYNIDYLWWFKPSMEGGGPYMLIEEKRYNSGLRFDQKSIFVRLSGDIKSDDFKGFHKIIFEKTNPDDGRMWLDDEEITRDELIEFLRFEAPEEKYKSYF